jgi:hypothetical protein
MSHEPRPLASDYLDLLRDALTGVLYQDPPLYKVRIGTASVQSYIAKIREYGRDVPTRGLTMIGTRRMDNLRLCVETVLRDGVPGDLMEAGVWRGGATIYMRGVLKAYGVVDRRVWVADSFQGLPTPSGENQPGDDYWAPVAGYFAAGLEEVQRNFARFALLDERVRFLPGWFNESMPSAPIEQLSLLRLDGDLYASITDVLEPLYDRMSPGGFVIVDDYDNVSCRQAVADFFARRGIAEHVHDIDGNGAYWRVSSAG